jgi:GT2 family glycosyltransferase
MKYSIIVPVYKHFEDCTKPCLESIAKNTDLSDVEVIVVANGCGNDGTREFVETLGNSFKLLWFPEPLGYTLATNLGIKVAKGEYIVLLNNDCVILGWQEKSDWLRMLEKPFLEDDKMAITGPTRIMSGPPYEPDCEGVGMHFIIFYCAMMKRVLFNELGLLDEIFSPGGGEDTDFSVKAQLAGYNIREVPIQREVWTYETSFPIYHAAERTVFDLPNWHEIIMRNRGILKTRYRGKS